MTRIEALEALAAQAVHFDNEYIDEPTPNCDCAVCQDVAKLKSAIKDLGECPPSVE